MDERLTHALARLPHGPQFRFVDCLSSLTPGKEGAGEYRVRGDESFLPGHFPGHPLFPGVLLVEAAAQLAGIVAQSDPEIQPLPGLKLTALKSIKILGAPKPGQKLEIHARITGRLANLVQAEVTIVLDSRKILQGELTLSGEAGAG